MEPPASKPRDRRSVTHSAYGIDAKHRLRVPLGIESEGSPGPLSLMVLVSDSHR